MKKILTVVLAISLCVLAAVAVNAYEIKEYEMISMHSDMGTSGASCEEVAQAVGRVAYHDYTFVEGSAGNANEGPENLWDNDPATKFCCACDASTTIYSVAKTAEPITLEGLVMGTANDNESNPGRNPSEWAILVSEDGNTWTEFSYGFDTFFEDKNFTFYGYFTSDTVANISYIAFQATGTESGCFQLSEVTLLGKPAAAAVDYDLTAEYVDYESTDTLAESLGAFASAQEAADAIGSSLITGYVYIDGTAGNGGEGPDNLWDGSTGSKFCTSTFPTLSLAALPAPATIDGFMMATANDNASYNQRSPYEWGIFVSEDGSNWKQLAYGDDYFFEETNFTYYAAKCTPVENVNFVLFQSEGALSGTFQVSEVTLTGAAAVVEEPVVYTYPASGAGDNIITGTIIGNETGWGDSAEAGRAAGFDGNPATFFDPLGVGDGFLGIDAGESYILDKAAILSRAGQEPRFVGAMIQGSNDGENWTTLWTSDAEGSNAEYAVITEFENNTGYSMYRYFNETNHGDVAEVEFYGNPGKVEEVVEEVVEEEAPAAEEVVEEAPAAEEVVEEAPAAEEVVEEAPQTFDFAIIAAVAAIVSAAGYAVSKKH